MSRWKPTIPGGLQATASPSPSAAAPRSASRRSRRSRRIVVGGRSTSSSQTSEDFWRRLVTDSQLRWLGPEKGVIHLATAAMVNAVWDLYAKLEGKPLWKLLADMTPEQLVACVDFRYIDDALTPDEALALLAAQRADQGRAGGELLARGLPGLHDIRRLARLRRGDPAPSAHARRSPPASRT